MELPFESATPPRCHWLVRGQRYVAIGQWPQARALVGVRQRGSGELKSLPVVGAGLAPSERWSGLGGLLFYTHH